MGHEYDALRNLEARMTASELRTHRLEDDFGSLKLLLEKNNTNLEEFIEISKGFKIGLRLLAWVESVAVWIAKVAAAFAVLWGAWKFLIKEAIK